MLTLCIQIYILRASTHNSQYYQPHTVDTTRSSKYEMNFQVTVNRYLGPLILVRARCLAIFMISLFPTKLKSH